MFSLIVTIISIALVAALALATLYYGGSAFNKGAAEATAAKILLQGQQLLAAAELYKADNGKWPPTLAALVSSNYLKSLPVALGPMGEAFAADRQWQMPSSGTPVFVLQDLNVATCQSLNMKAYGVSAVLKTARTDYLSQCFGLSTKALKVVVGKTSGDLLAAAADPAAGALLGAVVGQRAPSSLASPEWLDLSGAGDTPTPVDPAPALLPLASFSTLYLDFGPVATNTTETRQVQLSNPGTGVLVLTAVPGLSAGSAAAFTPLLTECGASLAVNASCVTEVSFSPTVVGAVAGTLNFETNAAGSPAEVELHATAYNPVSLTAAALPSARLNQAYAPFDFAGLLGVSNEATPDKSLVAWSKQGALPTGLSLSSTGVLSGTPSTLTAGAGADFTLLATYKLNNGQQVYTLRVGEIVLEVTSISAGGTHTCAVTTAGAAKCWGDDSDGQLGDDAALVNQPTPVEVAGLSSGVINISAGTAHTCAVTTAGAALCWGNNGGGRLGSSATGVNHATPVGVEGLSSGVASISAGDGHTCALTRAGAALCWGYGGEGQLGDGSNSTGPIPVAVAGLSSGVASLSAGNDYTCAVTKAGAALCWGRNYEGQLGTGPASDNQYSPLTVVGLSSGVASIATGSRHACARTTAGAALCWGQDTYGQLGNDAALVSTRAPGVVAGLSSGVVGISAGTFHTCALTTVGAVMCWGYGGVGALGNGTFSSKTTPVAVTGISSDVANIFAGGYHTCAVTKAGAAKCWGWDVYGALGNDADFINKATPVNVAP